MIEGIYFRGVLVGVVIGDTYTIKKKPEHFMRKFQGFGISKEVLYDLLLKGVKRIKMDYTGDIQKFVPSGNYKIKEAQLTL